jgi:dihydroneopterin aldolase / 2-amino-4-hydroxy-6-hydroxymethyldihydropteridine diphosphokinase
VSPDRIALRGVRAVGYHGVFEHERRDGQEFVVDVDVALDLTPAGDSDDLADTYDYGALASAVVARVEGAPFDLVERLATVIAQDVLGDVRVDEVRVTVHKPQAPVPVRFEDVAVTVVRARAPRSVVIGVGGNLPHAAGSPLEVVRSAVEMLGSTPGVSGLRSSPPVETDPVGGPPGQPAYVNAVAVATTTLPPRVLLDVLHRIEAHFDRRRDVRWGPRTVDLDIIQYGDPSAGDDVVSDDPALTLPHPRAHERAFVLAPWLAVDPDAVLRREGAVVAVADLLSSVGTTGVRSLADASPSVPPETS